MSEREREREREREEREREERERERERARERERERARGEREKREREERERCKAFLSFFFSSSFFNFGLRKNRLEEEQQKHLTRQGSTSMIADERLKGFSS